MTRIPVLLVDDSPIALVVLKKMIATDPGIEVVGTAANGLEGMEMIARVRPKVVLTDLHMPKMDGLGFTRAVMSRNPLPILVVSVSVQQNADDHTIFELLEAGAIDVFPKPRGGLNSAGEALSRELTGKIRLLSGVVPIRRHRNGGEHPARQAVPLPGTALHPRSPVRMVAIGASTGGPQALLDILSALPATFSAPILCVQHISEGFLQEMISWLNGHTRLSVGQAPIGRKPEPGHVYFPPEGAHLVIDSQGCFALESGHGNEAHRPSIDIALRSVADHYRQGAVGVLLTGMGQDGAEGMRAIFDRGGLTIAQDEASCVVFGMPAQAIRLGAASQVLPVSRIAAALTGLFPAGQTVLSAVVGGGHGR